MPSRQPRAKRRRYTRQAAVTDALRRHLAALRARGQTFLPAERQLARRLGASRMTLRKSLATLLAENQLTRGARGTVIRPAGAARAATPAALPSFAFVTYGGTAGIRNFHWRALWKALLPRAHARGLRPELVLLDWYDSRQSWDLFLAHVPPVVVVTSLSVKDYGAIMRSLLNSPATVVGADLNLTAWTEHVVAVDEYAAGREAARLLAAAGYRQPAFLGQQMGIPYLPYSKRQQGFRDGVRETGMRWTPQSTVWVRASVPLAFRDAALPRLPALLDQGFDAFFVHSDETIADFYAALQKRRRIPDEVGLVTFASTDAATGHRPPIACVGHNTTVKAEALVHAIRRRCDGAAPGPGLVLVPPDVQPGASLRAAGRRVTKRRKERKCR